MKINCSNEAKKLFLATMSISLLALFQGCQKDDNSSDPNLVSSWEINEDGSTAPWGIAIDKEGNVYTSELLGSRISKFTASGTLITRGGTYGNGNGQFDYPKYIAVDGSNNVYVADNMNARIQKFTSSGTYITQWGEYGEGTGNGNFNGPTGIAVNTVNGNVYVIDSNNGRIEKFDLSGNYIAQWGSYGTDNGQFIFDKLDQTSGSEGDMDIDATGNVYVVDNSNYRIQKFTSNGTYIMKWGSQGSGEGQFLYPCGIAIDNRNGFIYVSDNSLQNGGSNNVARIEKFDLSGQFIKQWTYENQSFGALAVDSAGNVLAISGRKVNKYAFQ